MNDRLDQAIKRISASELVLLAGGFLVLHRHKRWHLLTLNYFGTVLGLHTVHFLSDSRGRSTVGEWLSLGRIVSMEEVSEILPQEVEAKVLAQAEHYLPWIQQGLLDIGGGPTTNKQEFVDIGPAQPEQMLIFIRKMMDERKQGPFLRFRSTYQSFSDIDT